MFSLITAITESESRPWWVDSSVPLTITIGDSAPDSLTEDYLARINKRTIIDGTAHQDFSANSLDIEMVGTEHMGFISNARFCF